MQYNTSAASLAHFILDVLVIVFGTRCYPPPRSHRALARGPTLLNSAVIVTFTYIQKGFWTALSLRDAPQFYRMARGPTGLSISVGRTQQRVV